MFQLGDFNLPPLVLQRLCSDRDFVVDLASTAGAVWCHVLPRYDDATCWTNSGSTEQPLLITVKIWMKCDLIKLLLFKDSITEPCTDVYIIVSGSKPEGKGTFVKTSFMSSERSSRW